MSKEKMTDKEQKDIIENINFFFAPPNAVKVVGETDKTVSVLYDNGKVFEWDKDVLL